MCSCASVEPVLMASCYLRSPMLTAKKVTVPGRLCISSILTHTLEGGHLSNTFPATCRPAQLCKLYCNQPAKAARRKNNCKIRDFKRPKKKKGLDVAQLCSRHMAFQWGSTERHHSCEIMGGAVFHYATLCTGTPLTLPLRGIEIRNLHSLHLIAGVKHLSV